MESEAVRRINTDGNYNGMKKITGNRWSRAIAILCLAAAVAGVSGCSKEPKTNTSKNPLPTPTTAVRPTDPDTDDDTEPALRPEAQQLFQLKRPEQGELCAEVVFDGYGSVFVRLFENQAKKAVENFRTLAANGYYNGIKVNRIVADYMIQAGDREGTGQSGESIYGGGFANEISSDLHPIRGALCMANLGDESTNTTQFFFVQTKNELIRGLADPLDNRYHMTLSEYFKEAYGTTVSDEDLELYRQYGGAPWLNGHNTVFGQIYEGYGVMDALMSAKVTSRLKPNPTVIISEIRIFRFGEPQ